MEDIFARRRSVRRFQQRQIDPETLTEIFKAAQMAPSWGNQQCCELVVVDNQDVKNALAELLSKKNPATKCTADAPVVIGVCGDPLKSGYYNGKQSTRYSHWFLYDLGLVSQNICLKACELGLGSVIVGSFDHQRAEALLEVPAGYQLVALIVLGYPDHDPSPPKRRGLDEFVHFGRFGKGKQL